jgi:nicotinamide riboside kinase
MKKTYQIISNNTIPNNLKKTIVYYNECGIEETKENYSENYKIRNGYTEFYLTKEVPVLYQSLSEEIKELYLLIIKNEIFCDDEGELNSLGKEELKNKIRNLYSNKISNINGMREYVERFIIDSTSLPQNITDERESLKTEYHDLINYLGL